MKKKQCEYIRTAWEAECRGEPLSATNLDRDTCEILCACANLGILQIDKNHVFIRSQAKANQFLMDNEGVYDYAI